MLEFVAKFAVKMAQFKQSRFLIFKVQSIGEAEIRAETNQKDYSLTMTTKIPNYIAFLAFILFKLA